jgi:hypothetical protein
LRSALGNRALRRVLQREGLTGEIVRDVGAVSDPKEWTKDRSGDVRPLYAEVAKLANAARLRDVKSTAAEDINTARSARKGERDIKPGLNFVANLTGKGECGFVDAQGVYQGPALPRTLDGPLPKVAVMLGPKAFHGGKDGALGTLRHEMKHAEHFQMMIDHVARWRGGGAKAGSFDSWVDKQKGIGKVERALLAGERSGNTANTEVLAYVEGFINTFHLRQVTPSASVAVDYPPALYELRRAGEEFAKAEKDVKAAALDRLRDYVKTVLTAKEQAQLRAWLTFLLNPPAGDDSATKLLRNDFTPIAGFLKQVLGLVP